jgi:hypothetical protein
MPTIVDLDVKNRPLFTIDRTWPLTLVRSFETLTQQMVFYGVSGGIG